MQYTYFIFFLPQDHLSAVKEVEELQGQLRKQKQQLQQTAQELEQLRKASHYKPAGLQDYLL